MITHAFVLAAVMLCLALVTLGLTGLLASVLARTAEPPMVNIQRKELTAVRQQ